MLSHARVLHAADFVNYHCRLCFAFYFSIGSHEVLTNFSLRFAVFFQGLFVIVIMPTFSYSNYEKLGINTIRE